jgi:hypothetical protein
MKMIKYLLTVLIIFTGLCIVLIAYFVRVCHIITMHGQAALPARLPAKHVIDLRAGKLTIRKK